MQQDQQSLIYLATTYTHNDPAIVQQRYEIACELAGLLILQGHLIYSPIAHSHSIAQIGRVPGDWRTWQPQCEGMLRRCNELWVVQMSGWEKSVGIAAEINLAVSFGLTISKLDPDTLECTNWIKQ